MAIGKNLHSTKTITDITKSIKNNKQVLLRDILPMNFKIKY